MTMTSTRRRLTKSTWSVRTRELKALLNVSHNLAATLELAPLLGLILDQLKEVVYYSSSGIHALEAQANTALEYLGPLPRHRVVGRVLPQELASIQSRTVHRRGPVIIRDLGGGGTPMTRALAADGVLTPPAAVNHGRAFLCVPLIVKGNVTGRLDLV